MKLGKVIVVGKATQIPFKQVAIQAELEAPEVYEEYAALLRFWKRRAFFAFTPVESCPPGELDYSINFDHLNYALAKVKYYSELLASRDSTEK